MIIHYADVALIGDLFPPRYMTDERPFFTRSGRTYYYTIGARNSGYRVYFDSPKGLRIDLDFNTFPLHRHFVLTVSVPSERVDYITTGDTANIKTPQLRRLVELAMADIAAEVPEQRKWRAAQAQIAQEAQARDLESRL
jgi:hypothetical protein